MWLSAKFIQFPYDEVPVKTVRFIFVMWLYNTIHVL